MAGKGDGKNLKRSKNCKLDVERFAYDILSSVLTLCGFPKEKIKCKQGKQNVYRNNDYIHRTGIIVASFALSFRDEWKIMFESRFKSYGLDTNEKIEKYLTSFFAVSHHSSDEISAGKVANSLAVYSEIMLFLNHKGMQFDVNQLLNMWSRYITQYTEQRNTDILLNLFKEYPERHNDWVESFIRDVACPYGSKDVSTLFRFRINYALIKKSMQDNQMVESTALISVAEELEPVLPAIFNSPAVLPGDRISPEPMSSNEKGAVGGKELSSSASDRECRSGRRQRSKTSLVLDMNDRFQQMSLKSKKFQQGHPDKMSKKGKSKKKESC